MFNTLRITFTILFVCATLRAAFAQPDAEIDIDAHTLLERHIDAVGGRDAITAIKDRSMQATMILTAGDQTIDGSISEIRAYPNKCHHMIALIVQGEQMLQEQWIDGTNIVQLSMGEKKSLGGDILAAKLEEYQFNELVRVEELDYTLTVTAKNIEDGKGIYTLEVKKKYNTIYWFIDAENYYLVGTLEKFDTEQGKAEVRIRFSDFKSVDGVVLAHKQSVDAGPTHAEVVISSFKHNMNPPDGVFTTR
jgi:zinc protease